MKNNRLILILSVGFAAVNMSCSEVESNSTTTVVDLPQIKLTPFTESPEYMDAILEMNMPTEGAKLDTGKTQFSYTTKNYELGTQTPDAPQKMCANSAKGQHIHLILNNEPYFAYYDAEFSHNLAEGSYTALSFISRSYHESIKNPNAYVIRQFTVGNAEPKFIDASAPHLFYSRPKGAYNGTEETQKVMLDFYLVNTALSENGNKVRATINGEEFMITEWKPFYIEGLPLGESTIKLELLDSNNQLIASPYNPVERKITLTELQ